MSWEEMVEVLEFDEDEKERNVYNKRTVSLLVEDDEMDSYEAAFMQGYLEEGEVDLSYSIVTRKCKQHIE